MAATERRRRGRSPRRRRRCVDENGVFLHRRRRLASSPVTALHRRSRSVAGRSRSVAGNAICVAGGHGASPAVTERRRKRDLRRRTRRASPAVTERRRKRDLRRRTRRSLRRRRRRGAGEGGSLACGDGASSGKYIRRAVAPGARRPFSSSDGPARPMRVAGAPGAADDRASPETRIGLPETRFRSPRATIASSPATELHREGRLHGRRRRSSVAVPLMRARQKQPSSWLTERFSA
jgi:hypothetical protein